MEYSEYGIYSTEVDISLYNERSYHMTSLLAKAYDKPVAKFHLLNHIHAVRNIVSPSFVLTAFNLSD